MKVRQLHQHLIFSRVHQVEINSEFDEITEASEIDVDEENKSEENKSDTKEITANRSKSRSSVGGKKDPFLRRQELLVKSGLAKVCCITKFIVHVIYMIFFSLYMLLNFHNLCLLRYFY